MSYQSISQQVVKQSHDPAALQPLERVPPHLRLRPACAAGPGDPPGVQPPFPPLLVRGLPGRVGPVPVGLPPADVAGRLLAGRLCRLVRLTGRLSVSHAQSGKGPLAKNQGRLRCLKLVRQWVTWCTRNRLNGSSRHALGWVVLFIV